MFFSPGVLFSVMGCCDTPLLSHLTPWHVHDHHHRHHHHHHHLTQGWHVHDHHHQPWCVIFVKALVYLGSLPLKVCFSCKVQLASVEPTFVQKQKQQRRKNFQNLSFPSSHPLSLLFHLLHLLCYGLWLPVAGGLFVFLFVFVFCAVPCWRPSFDKCLL